MPSNDELKTEKFKKELLLQCFKMLTTEEQEAVLKFAHNIVVVSLGTSAVLDVLRRVKKHD